MEKIYGFEEIFKELKETSGPSAVDPNFNYNLGVASREMGFLDDAIEQFQIALEKEQNPFEAANMLGLCHKEKGQWEEAAQAFQKALKRGGDPPRKSPGGQIRVGTGLQRAGENGGSPGALKGNFRSRPRNTEIQKTRSPGSRGLQPTGGNPWFKKDWRDSGMAVFNYAKKEIDAKIVYYGPAISGKTTNLQFVHQHLKPDQRGKMVSLATNEDRTLFFDFLPIELESVRGFKTRFHLYTVPGQVYYGATRRAVLTGADGVVFVADSHADRMEDNLASFKDLEDNLRYYGKKIEGHPSDHPVQQAGSPRCFKRRGSEPENQPAEQPLFRVCRRPGQGGI